MQHNDFHQHLIQRPHSTTPTASRKLQLHLHHHHHHYHHHYHRYHPSHQHQHSWSSPLHLDPPPANNHHPFHLPPPLLPHLITPVTSKPSSSRSSPLQPRHRTPPSPLLSPISYSRSPSKLVGNGLTRANSLPGQIPRSSLNTSRLSPHSRSRFSKPMLPSGSHHGSPPPLTKLPTSPTPASAVTGESGLTVAGRMVEYESDHSRSEALSRALRAVSQSGIGRSRNRSRHPLPIINHRSLSYTAASSITSPSAESYNQACSPFSDNLTPMSREEGFGVISRPRPIARTSTLTPPTPTTDEMTSGAVNIVRGGGEDSGPDGFPFGYQEGWDGRCLGGGHAHERAMEAPNSQTSGYISFSSLNLFAPPSPPHSLNEFNPLHDQRLHPTPTDIPPPSSHNLAIRRPMTP